MQTRREWWELRCREGHSWEVEEVDMPSRWWPEQFPCPECGGPVSALQRHWIVAGPLTEPGWTTDPPTEPGHYWAWHSFANWGPEIVKITTTLEMWAYGMGELKPIASVPGTHWLGPITPPEPPKEGEG